MVINKTEILRGESRAKLKSLLYSLGLLIFDTCLLQPGPLYICVNTPWKQGLREGDGLNLLSQLEQQKNLRILKAFNRN